MQYAKNTEFFVFPALIFRIVRMFSIFRTVVLDFPYFLYILPEVLTMDEFRFKGYPVFETRCPNMDCPVQVPGTTGLCN